jgi:chromosome segregation protein
VRSIRPQAGKKDESCASEAGFQGFAVDRIRFDERYRNIFEYLLGRVVIIDNLENAVRASKKNRNALRFVTLDGEVINASGAMTGGAYKNKTAGFLERKGEIAKLSEKLAELEAGRSEAGERLALLNRRVSEYSDDAGRAERDYREKEIEKISADNEIRNLEGQRAELLSRQGKWEKEIESVVSEQKRSGETAERLRGEIVNLAAKEAEFEHKIELLAAECEADRAELDALNESVTETRLAAGAAESEKHNGDQAVLRVQTGVAELRGEKQSREDAYKELLGEEAKLCSGGTDLEGVAREKEQEQAELERLLADIRERRAEISRRMEEADAAKNRLEDELEDGQNRKYENEVRQAKNEARLDSLKSRLWDEFEISYVQAIAFRKAEFAASSAVKESREIKNRMNELGEVNVGAVREYETVNERCAFLQGQRADLVEAMASLRKIIEDMDRVIVTGFRESFNKIAGNFSESFHMLFGGGKGEIRLEDEKNPLECGVEINAQPPGKKLQNMNLLSGGEKTMTAIALMFAILKAKPAPFCVLDEVEAALDESNICRFAGCLASFKETRFAIVTHQKATMEYADALYGVTMPEQGVSRVISLRLGDAETDEFARRLGKSSVDQG